MGSGSGNGVRAGHWAACQDGRLGLWVRGSLTLPLSAGVSAVSREGRCVAGRDVKVTCSSLSYYIRHFS
eukprot:XP_001689474.1 predicted protein [Chlamydomonas reinhardtii]